ncbi:MAG: SRPBCC family protein, partial [Caldilineae bacterium]
MPFRRLCCNVRWKNRQEIKVEYNTERFKWPVSVSRSIEAPPQQIWSVITTPGNLETCHPFCKKNPVYKWPGIGSRDAIHYHSGWILHREFVNWIDGVGYDLTIGREGGRKSYVTWRITEERGNAGRLTITIYPYIFQNVP